MWLNMTHTDPIKIWYEHTQPSWIILTHCGYVHSLVVSVWHWHLISDHNDMKLITWPNLKQVEDLIIQDDSNRSHQISSRFDRITHNQSHHSDSLWLCTLPFWISMTLSFYCSPILVYLRTLSTATAKRYINPPLSPNSERHTFPPILYLPFIFSLDSLVDSLVLCL